MNTPSLKKIKIIFGSLLAAATAPLFALAADTAGKDTPVSINLPNEVKSFLQPVTNNAYSTFTNIFNFIFGMAFALVVLALIANGIRYIAAFGNEEQVEKAKNGVYYSIMGLVLLIIAYTIAATINFIFAGR